MENSRPLSAQQSEHSTSLRLGAGDILHIVPTAHGASIGSPFFCGFVAVCGPMTAAVQHAAVPVRRRADGRQAGPPAYSALIGLCRWADRPSIAAVRGAGAVAHITKATQRAV